MTLRPDNKSFLCRASRPSVTLTHDLTLISTSQSVLTARAPSPRGHGVQAKTSSRQSGTPSPTYIHAPERTPMAICCRSNLLRSSTRLRQIISDPTFVGLFGEPKPHPKGERQSIFGMDDELKVAPKGIDKNHKYALSMWLACSLLMCLPTETLTY